MTLSSFRLIVSVSVIPEENGKGEIHCKLQTEERLLDTLILRKMNLWQLILTRKVAIYLPAHVFLFGFFFGFFFDTGHSPISTIWTLWRRRKAGKPRPLRSTGTSRKNGTSRVHEELKVTQEIKEAREPQALRDLRDLQELWGEIGNSVFSKLWAKERTLAW